MARPPGFYASLEEAHRQVQADLDKGIDPKAEHEPTIEQTATPGFYGPLEEAHRQVQADLDKGIDLKAEHEPAIEQEPTRPEGHPAEGPGWTDRGDMVSQQRSAMEWVRHNHELRSQNEPEAAAVEKVEKSDEVLYDRYAGLTRDDDSHRDHDRDQEGIEQGIERSPGDDGRGG
jgi:hypothetical protein